MLPANQHIMGLELNLGSQMLAQLRNIVRTSLVLIQVSFSDLGLGFMFGLGQSCTKTRRCGLYSTIALTPVRFYKQIIFVFAPQKMFIYANYLRNDAVNLDFILPKET